MAAKAIMIQGTMSNSGKTFVTAGLCRVFKQDGYKVAPFKSQNMALNSYITKEGLEIGRAQAMQAEAAMIEPSVLMNPILLKPTTTMGSQVIVNGEVYDNLSAVDYYKQKHKLKPMIMEAYNQLALENDIIVIEGAGSPAEINLLDDDIVNMGMAKMADADVLLVADIDRGGVFASLFGTINLLEKEEQDRIKGTIINKFRGDVEILKPGLKMMEDLVEKPVIGVIPLEQIDVDDEDSLSDRLNHKTVGEGLDVAVIRLPHISNFTDFSVFDLIDGVSLRYVTQKKELGHPDLILLPGTKNTMSDMVWLRESGLEGAIIRESRSTRVIGICGGFQMLGQELHDEEGVEFGGSMRGMGLLDTTTTFEHAKTRTQIEGIIKSEFNYYGLDNRTITGYEIHMGVTSNLGKAYPFIELSDGRYDGYCNEDGSVWGSYLHGIFDNEDLVYGLIHTIMKEKGIDPHNDHISLAEYKEQQYDKLADLIRNSLDMDYIYGLLEAKKTKEIMDDPYMVKDWKKGLIHIYCGNGKGKTTCAMGLIMRAAGSGRSVLLYQFLKDNTSSELNSIAKLKNVTRRQGEASVKFSFQMNEQEQKDLKERNDNKLRDILAQANDYDMLVLDEVIYAIERNLVSENILIDYLIKKPEKLEVILTGQGPSARLIELADYVSEIHKVKHPFDEGVVSREGIEK